MPSLEQRFQRLLSIREETLKLVAEAQTLLPQGGTLILSELQQQLPPAEARSESSPATVSAVTAAPTTTAGTPLSSAQPTEEEAHPHPYNPRPEGPLKGKSLGFAVEEVMKNNFSEVPGVNRQIMAILAEQGFDGFPAHSLDDPIDLVRNILSNHPNVERPSRKTYLWVPKANTPEETQGPNALPLSAPPLTTTQPRREATDDASSPPNQEEQTGLRRDAQTVTFLELVSQESPAGEPTDNGNEDL
jgi:hypothetical protein